MFTYIQLYILRVKYGYDVYITEKVLVHLIKLFSNVSRRFVVLDHSWERDLF